MFTRLFRKSFIFLNKYNKNNNSESVSHSLYLVWVSQLATCPVPSYLGSQLVLATQLCHHHREKYLLSVQHRKFPYFYPLKTFLKVFITVHLFCFLQFLLSRKSAIFSLFSLASVQNVNRFKDMFQNKKVSSLCQQNTNKIFFTLREKQYLCLCSEQLKQPFSFE